MTGGELHVVREKAGGEESEGGEELQEGENEMANITSKGMWVCAVVAYICTLDS